MVYQGSKDRIKKFILPIMLEDRQEGQYFVEPFVGGCNSLCHVDNPRIGADSNPYLVAMWKDLQDGRAFPTDISREEYNHERTLFRTGLSSDLGRTGYIGFNGSYGGRFFDGGYAGTTVTKSGKVRNYPNERYNNIMKQVPMIKGIEFYACEYDKLVIPNNSIIYCDIPYKGTKQYINSGNFDYDKFYDWCRYMRNLGHTIFVSEYSMPEDFIEVWSKPIKVGLKQDNSKTNIEKLFKLK
jgi:DNA adenine methylase